MPQFKVNKLLLSMTLLAIVGFTDASFVALKTLQGQTVPCSILKGCDIVLQSKYAHLFGQPVALWGALYYGAVILLIAAFLIWQREYIIRGVVLLTAFGSIMSVWFIYLQVFVIKSICLYCLISAGSSFLLLGLSVIAMTTIYKIKS